jgi:hypothetical protein
MKRLVRIGASAILATIAFGSFAPAASAVENESFGLTPQPERVDGTDRSSFSIPLEQGATFEDSIRVYNRTDQPIELAVYAADAQADVDTAVSVGLRESQPKGVGAWIDLSENQLTLPGRGEISVTFRVEVRSSDPSPDLGAIVVEPTGRGLAEETSNRLSLVVRTAPPNSPTTSVRVRPLLLQSPWIIVAIIGLLVALVVIVIGTRRARRTKDVVVPAGEIEHEEEEADDVQEASRPVIRRLGERPDEPRPGTRTTEVPVVSDERFSTAEEVVDDRPMLDDDMLVEVDDVSDEGYEEEDEEVDEEYLPPARTRQAPARSKARKASPAKAKAKAKAKPKSAAKPKPKKVVRKAANKPAARQPRKFIPLDDI